MPAVQMPPSNVPLMARDGSLSQPWRSFFLAVEEALGGYSSVGAQPADPTLTALAALNASAGLVAQTGADTFTKRTLQGAVGEIEITNGNGAASNPTIGLEDTAVTPGTYANPTSITVDAKGRITAISS